MLALTECPKGPVLMGDNLYIFCGIEDHGMDGETNRIAHLIRASDWEYIQIFDWPRNENMPGHVPLGEIFADPVAITVVKGETPDV